jgi:hypothetical protein
MLAVMNITTAVVWDIILGLCIAAGLFVRQSMPQCQMNVK